MTMTLRPPPERSSLMDEHAAPATDSRSAERFGAAPPDSPPDDGPARQTDWRQAAEDAAWTGGSAIVGHALGVVIGVLLRCFLSPAHMGVWQGLKLVLGYANYANLGVAKGAAREFCIVRGQGDVARAERGWHVAFTVNLLSSLGYAAAVVAAGAGLGLFGGGTWSAVWGWASIGLAPAIVVQRHVTFHVTMLRCRREFALAARFSVVEAALTLGVTCVATWLWGLTGIVLGTLASMLLGLAWLKRRGAADLWPVWDFGEVRRLTSIGAPILAAGVVGTLFRSLDKLLILACLEDRERQLGVYSLALLAFAQLYGLGNALASVMQPRYGEAFGRTDCRRQATLLAARASEPLAAAVALLAGLSAAVAGPIFSLLLPAYAAGIEAALWLMPGAVALVLAIPPHQALVAVDRQGAALAGVSVATLALAGLNGLVLYAGGGIEIVAAATSLAYIGYYALTAAQAYARLTAADRRRYAAAMAAAVAPVLAVAFAGELWQPSAECGWGATLAKLAGLLAASGVTAWVGCRRFGWHVALRRWGKV